MGTSTEAWEGAGRERGLRGERGAASLTIALGLALIMTLMGLAFLVYARRQSSLVGADQESAQALYAAEAGFERSRRDIEARWRGYLRAISTSPTHKTDHQLRWFRCSKVGPSAPDFGCDSTAFTGNVFDFQYYQNVDFPTGTPTAKYSVAVDYDYTNKDASDTGNYVNAIITVTGRAGATEKEKIVEGVVRFEVAPSQVFNYAYFINNRAEIDIGTNARINGHVRANGNILMRSGLVNGEIIAGLNADLGTGNGQKGEGCVEDPNGTVTDPGTGNPYPRLRYDPKSTYQNPPSGDQHWITGRRPAKP